MRREYDFSNGVRGKHVGKRLRIVGDLALVESPTPPNTVNQSSKNLVGTAGEYYVCAELCRRGYLALLTPKNNLLFDVVATNPNGTASVSIQVKTRSIENNQGWKIGAPKDSAATPGDPFVVLVNLRSKGAPDFYVYRYSEFVARVSEEFASYISKPKKNGEPRKDPGFRAFDERHFTESDKARKNNWGPIETALQGNGSQDKKKRG